MKLENNSIMEENGGQIGVHKNKFTSQQNIFDGPGSPDNSIQTSYLGKIKLEQLSMARLGGGDLEGGADIEPRGVFEGEDTAKNQETKGKSFLSSRL